MNKLHFLTQLRVFGAKEVLFLFTAIFKYILSFPLKSPIFSKILVSKKNADIFFAKETL